MLKEKCEAKNCSKKPKYIVDQKYNLCEYHKCLFKHLDRGDSFNKEKYKTCQWCGSRTKRNVEHHYKYEPERTIQVCDSCHQQIHNSDNHILKPSEIQMKKNEW